MWPHTRRVIRLTLIGPEENRLEPYPKCRTKMKKYRGGGSTGLGNIPKKQCFFFSASLIWWSAWWWSVSGAHGLASTLTRACGRIAEISHRQVKPWGWLWLWSFSTECPIEWPDFGSSCSPTQNFKCTYGEECCCGQCHPRLAGNFKYHGDLKSYL